MSRPYSRSYALPPVDSVIHRDHSAPTGPGTFAVIDGDGGENNLFGTSDDDTISGYGGDDTCRGNDGQDNIYGGTENDILTGHNGIDQLFGGTGNDILQGGGGNFTQLNTLHASDILKGGTGNDTMVLDYEDFIIVSTSQPARIIVDINSGVGRVKVSGYKGENFDNIERLVCYGPDGNDTIVGGALNDDIRGLGGSDLLRGGGGDDLIVDTGGFVDADGGAGDDLFSLNRSSEDGTDLLDSVIDCNAGTITVGGGSQGTFRNFERFDISSGDANDVITGKNGGTNTLRGGVGNDTLIGGKLADTLYGGTENDEITGNGGDDTVNGGTGNDTIGGGAGNDIMNADGGIDTIHGDDGDDVVGAILDTTGAGSSYSGNSGFDILRIKPGTATTVDLTTFSIVGFERIDDYDGFYVERTFIMSTAQFGQFNAILLKTWSGNEDITIVLADNAGVTLPGTCQFDILQLAGGGQRVDMSQIATSGRPEVFGGEGDDTVIGLGFANFCDVSLNGGHDQFAGNEALDRVYGGSGNDNLSGGVANDTLYGDVGRDTLRGGDGADILTGGASADSLNGGVGLDKFAYTAASESTGKDFDTVERFDANAQDKFDLTFAVTGVDNKVKHGTLSDASFNGDLKDAIGKHQLDIHHAVLFKPDAGDHAGEQFLIIDVNGQKGYQANQDLVIHLEQAANLNALDITDFV